MLYVPRKTKIYSSIAVLAVSTWINFYYFGVNGIGVEFIILCILFAGFYLKISIHDFFRVLKKLIGSIFKANKESKPVLVKYPKCVHGVSISAFKICYKCRAEIEKYAKEHDNESIFNKSMVNAFNISVWVVIVTLLITGVIWKYVILISLACLGFCFLAGLVGKLVSSNEYLKNVKQRCVHNIAGATYIPELCPQCIENKKQQEAERILKKEEKKIKYEANRKIAYQEWVINVRQSQYLQTVDPQDFEKIVCQLFSKMGYRVEGTRYTGDSGSDGFLYKDDKKTVLQCKRVKGSVGEPILRDLYGTMHAFSCNNAVVVTTGSVSRQAREWVDQKPIRIIELDELNELFKKYFKENEVVPDTFTVNGFVDPDTCPECGKELRIRIGRRGKFMGCSGYPKCRYTRNVK